MKSKFAKFLLWCGVFALLGVIILWIEHGRCVAQLAAYQRPLAARGDKLTLRELLPPDPPAASNAAVVLSPILAHFNVGGWEELPWMQIVSSNRARVAERHDPLVQQSRTVIWDELSRSADQNSSHFANVVAATALPRLAFLTRANLDHLMDNNGQSFFLHSLGDWLALRAVVAAREGRGDEAWEAWRALLRLRSLMLNDPATFSDERWSRPVAFMVSWELLQRVDWTEARLAEAQGLWAKCRHLRLSASEEQMGRAMVFQSYDAFRSQPGIVALMVAEASGSGAMSAVMGGGRNWLELLIDNTKAVLESVAECVPRTVVWPWWTSYGDELWMLREYDQMFAAVRAAVAGNAALPVLTRWRASAQPEPSNWWPLACSVNGFQPMEQFFLKAVAQETQTRLAVTAIAIRRHQLRHQRLPGSLGALVPDFLDRIPDDPMDGKPLRYQPQLDGTFLLYSVGEDGVDQGGDATEKPPRSSGSTIIMVSGVPSDNRWQNGLDWIWPLPAPAEETEKQAAEYLSKRTPGPGIPLPPPPTPPAATPP